VNSKNSTTHNLAVHLVAAARPNFMKIAPLYHALRKEPWADPIIVHTGQHYDLNMSDAFFADLQMPEPDIHLGVGSGTHAEQTGKVMITYEKILMETKPDVVVVVGDVNSTMAATLAANKIVCPKSAGKRHVTSDKDLYGGRQMQRPLVAHLEAGLRSFDRTMPEEINRIVTDALADILWTPSPDADENLKREGVLPGKIIRVGNIMIDSLEMLRSKIEAQAVHQEFGLNAGSYGVVTLHRPSNVDDPSVLGKICGELMKISRQIPLVFPIHPRTRKNLEENGLMGVLSGSETMHLVEPLNYIRFMSLVFHCGLAITDSGGIQEETTYLGIPCLTMRPNTERPITVSEGTNRLCSIENVEELAGEMLKKKDRRTHIPEYWDGNTAARVVNSIKKFL
jgi:UDP-N-acetylglucosamine 2-epimerase (non-hydrolysing)